MSHCDAREDARPVEERAPVTRPSETDLLRDVIWRVVCAQVEIEGGDVGTAYGILRDLEDDLVMVVES